MPNMPDESPPAPVEPAYDPEPSPAPYPEITPDPSPAETPATPATPDDGRPYASTPLDGDWGTQPATAG
jgi:hypothetical protein